MANNFSILRFDLLLRINGVDYRCDTASLNFAINKIPSASCSLAVGRDLETLERATIHDHANDFGIMTVGQIIFEPKGQWNPNDSPDSPRWTAAKSQIIFEGYVTGLGYQKQGGSIRPTVYLTHWLSDLSFSSSLSNQSHPGNAYRFNWTVNPSPAGSTTTVRPPFIGSYANSALFNDINISEDLWGSTLHPFFCRLSETDVLSPAGADAPCLGLREQNIDSQKALRRMERRYHGAGDTIGASYNDGAGSPYHKPLAFNMDDQSGSVSSLLARAIRDSCSNTPDSEYFHSTLWDRLVAIIGPKFEFAVIPRIHTAIVAPLVPGLRTTFDVGIEGGKCIDMADVTYFDTTSLIPRPIRAVGVIAGSNSNNTGYVQAGDVAKVLGGCFAPDPQAQGMVLYAEPPDWLIYVGQHAHSPTKTLLADNPTSGSNPAPDEADSSSTKGDDNGETPTSANNAVGDYYVRAAKAIYAREVLRGRTAVLQGKLRFDLGPGTNVRIRNRNPLFIPKDQLSGDLVALITRVGISMSAESRQAGTSFQLDHIRTTKENESAGTSIEKHPLYDDAFTGAPLLHDYLFPEE